MSKEQLSVDYLVYEKYSPVLSADIMIENASLCVVSVNDRDDPSAGMTVRWMMAFDGDIRKVDLGELQKVLAEVEPRLKNYAGWLNPPDDEGT